MFSNRSKIEKFRSNMQILKISVRHFEYLMSCDFLQNWYSNDLYRNKDSLTFFLTFLFWSLPRKASDMLRVGHATVLFGEWFWKRLSPHFVLLIAKLFLDRSGRFKRQTILKIQSKNIRLLKEKKNFHPQPFSLTHNLKRAPHGRCQR